jgi:hypothetical protein
VAVTSRRSGITSAWDCFRARLGPREVIATTCRRRWAGCVISSRTRFPPERDSQPAGLADDSALSCHDVDQLARHNLGDIPHRVRELWCIARKERTIAGVLVASTASARFWSPYATGSRGEQHLTARDRRSVS